MKAKNLIIIGVSAIAAYYLISNLRKNTSPEILLPDPGPQDQKIRKISVGKLPNSF